MPELRVPARFEARASLDQLGWIGQTPAGRRALDHCQRFAENPGSVRAPILMGPSGCGKTTLLYAVARRIRERMVTEIEGARASLERRLEAQIQFDESLESVKMEFPIRRVVLARGSDIAHELRQSVEKRNLEEVVDRYLQVRRPNATEAVFLGIPREDSSAPGALRVLLVDDIEVAKMSDWLGSELYRIFDFRYSENLPTAIATNLAPEELRGHFGDRIARRLFDMGEAFELS